MSIEKPNFNLLLNSALCLGYLRVLWWNWHTSLEELLTALFHSSVIYGSIFLFFIDQWIKWLSKHHSMTCLNSNVLVYIGVLFLVSSLMHHCMASVGHSNKSNSYSQSFSGGSPWLSSLSWTSCNCHANHGFVPTTFWPHICLHSSSCNMVIFLCWGFFFWTGRNDELAYEILIACALN